MYPLKLLNVLSACKNVLPVRSNLSVRVCCISTKTLEERLGLPDKPKKPLTPYFRYIKEIRPTLTASNPKAHITDIVKLAAEKWNLIDPSKKVKYVEGYKKDQVEYLQKRAIYESKLTDEQRLEIQNYKQDLSIAKTKRELKKKTRELGKPKRPSSPFIKFLSDEKVKNPHILGKFFEWQKEMAEKWRLLPETEKDKYFKATKNEIQKHRVELSKWEEKMIRLGNIELVRPDALVEVPEKSAGTTRRKIPPPSSRQE